MLLFPSKEYVRNAFLFSFNYLQTISSNDKSWQKTLRLFSLFSLKTAAAKDVCYKLTFNRTATDHGWYLLFFW